MKTSISNIAWTNERTAALLPSLREVGIQGIEIAPTMIWPDLVNTKWSEISQFSNLLTSEGLSVSGIQSLSFGRPDLQLFEPSTWPKFRSHLKRMFEIGGELNANVAVFGSPKNRVKGVLSEAEANIIAIDFFTALIPDLEANNIALTLEPNAVAYGADYLTNYKDVVLLSQEIGSKWIIPQIDTGCMWMSGDEVGVSYSLYQPGHIHLSLPSLELFPGAMDFKTFLKQVNFSGYSGWVVIEMLNKSGDGVKNVISAAEKLQEMIEEIIKDV